MLWVDPIDTVPIPWATGVIRNAWRTVEMARLLCPFISHVFCYFSLFCCRSEAWECTWFKGVDGEREVTEWKRGEHCVRGEKSEKRPDGEMYNERYGYCLHIS